MIAHWRILEIEDILSKIYVPVTPSQKIEMIIYGQRIN